jgi:hypothetical protein
MTDKYKHTPHEAISCTCDISVNVSQQDPFEVRWLWHKNDVKIVYCLLCIFSSSFDIHMSLWNVTLTSRWNYFVFMLLEKNQINNQSNVS